MDEPAYNEFRKRIQRDPRTKNYNGAFDILSNGQSQKPAFTPEPVTEFLEHFSTQQVWKTYQALEGNFNYHYRCSVPGLLEAHLNFATAIALYEQEQKILGARKVNLLALSAGNGTFEKTISALTDGHVNSLIISATEANYLWHKAKPVKNSSFLWGSHAALIPAMLTCNNRLRSFESGFDYFIDQTATQMHEQPIEDQIHYIQQLANPLKYPVWIGFVKNSHPNLKIYEQNEQHKDWYKQQFFTEKQITEKQNMILKDMTTNQVSLEEYAAALEPFYKNVLYLGSGMVDCRSQNKGWQSSNFNWVIACRDEEKLVKICNNLQPFPGNDQNSPLVLYGNLSIQQQLKFEQYNSLITLSSYQKQIEGFKR